MVKRPQTRLGETGKQAQSPQNNTGGQELADTREVLSGYRALLSDLSLSRRVHDETLITRYLESLFLKTHEELYRPGKNLLARMVDLYHLEIPLLMRRMMNALISAFVLFVVGIVTGWLLVSAYSELVSLFAFIIAHGYR